MGKRRWLPKSQLEAEAISPENRRILSRAEEKHRKETKEARKLERNSERRERSLREKLMETEDEIMAQVEKAHEEAFEEAEEQYEGDVEELSGKVTDLKREVARHVARDRREPSRMDHAVKKALKHIKKPEGDLPNVRHVKDKHRVVRDWARNTIVTLVNQGVPISRTWPITKASADALGVTLVGTWSTRTSGRVVREGGIAASLMIMEYVLTCIGLCCDRWPHSLTHIVLSDDLQQ